MNKTEIFNNLYLKNNPESVQNFEFRFWQQFQGIDFENKKILEIGCGKGFLSLYIACFKNPAEVIALDEDEGEGSDPNTLDMVTQNIRLLELDNIKIVKNDVMNYFNDSYFDIIISNNALHHVCEHGLLKHDVRARLKYIKIFQHIRQLLKPNGILSIFEYSRKSIWRHLPSKRFKEIEWSLHPTRAEWLNVLKSSGYKVQMIKFVIPYKLRKLPFLVNSISLYFYLSSFYISAKSAR